MQSLMRAVCIAYLIFLTMLLLSDHPERVIGLQGELTGILKTLRPYAHVLSFSLLAVLALSVRWPLPRWGIILTMAAYGGLTELLQGLTRTRHPAWRDWYSDLKGIACGTLLCWVAAIAVTRFTRWRRGRNGDSAAILSDEWKTLQEALSRPAGGEQSWWS